MFSPVELFVGVRYIHARRGNHFIAFISMTAIVATALGVAVLLTILSIMNGFEGELRERILGMASHATISAPEGGLVEWREVMEKARQHPRVVGVAPYVEGQVMLVNGQNVSGAVIRGVLPEQEGEVSEVGDKMTSGRLTDLREGEFGIVLGKELAYALGLRVGDRVTVVTPQISPTPAGVMPRLKRFIVLGIFEVGMGEYDGGMAFIHLRDGAKLPILASAR